MFNDSLHIFYIVSCPQTHQLEKGSKIAKNNHICTFLNYSKRKKLKVTYKVCIHVNPPWSSGRVPEMSP